MKKYKIIDLCKITSSKRIFAHEYRQSGIPFYRGKEITQLYNHKDITDLLYIDELRYNEIKAKFGIPKSNDVLITAVGTIGSIYLVKPYDKFYFKDGNLMWLKEINQDIILPKYLFYFLISINGQNKIKEKTIGSTQTALTIDNFKTIEIKLPNITKQQHIINTRC